jgi:hypothetical protein
VAVLRISPTGATQRISLGQVNSPSKIEVLGPAVVAADGTACQTITTTDQFDRTTVAVYRIS